MNATADPITAARAAALFLSDVSTADQPTSAQVQAAIRRSLHTHGGTRGCVSDVAAAYGEHPELAAPRMRWARSVVECHYGRAASVRGHARTGAVGVARPPRDRVAVAA